MSFGGISFYQPGTTSLSPISAYQNQGGITPQSFSGWGALMNDPNASILDQLKLSGIMDAGILNSQEQPGLWGGFTDFLNNNAEGIGAMGDLMGGLTNIGKLWGGIQGLDLAKKQFRLQKQAYETNLAEARNERRRRMENIYTQNTALQGKYKTLEDYLGAHGANYT